MTYTWALQNALQQFDDERGWHKYHSLKNLSASIAIESAELMEHFQWLTEKEGDSKADNYEALDAMAMELADIMIYCLLFANKARIDAASAISQKMSINESRFPRVD